MSVTELAEAIGRARGVALDEISRALWAAHAAQQVDDNDAQRLSEAIQTRRMLDRATFRPTGSPQAFHTTTVRWKPQRPPQHSVALERRRRWAAAGRMPPRIAAHFTLGEQAALAVVAVEVTKRNTCTLAIGAIAALAGVSETTVRRALRQAKALGFVTVEERRLSRLRNDTNMVSIVSNAWTSWLRLARQGGGCQNRKGTSTHDLDKSRQRALGPSQKAAEGAGWAAVEPRRAAPQTRRTRCPS